jgi:L-lactate dehydrogenase (cytochrome)
MRASEIRRLIQLKPVELDAARRRLAACHDIHELRKSARRVIPRPVFDYVDGAADEELSMAANVRAFRRWRFQPRALTGITEVDTATRLLDRDLPLPLVLAPTGYTRMMHPAGESGVARAAQRHRLPYTLSTMSTTSIEDVAAAAQPDLWFQLYIQKDEGLTKELVNRADAAGYRVLVVTVDTFVTGHRTRDERNGLTIPPALTMATIGNIAIKPAYWIRMLRSEAIDFANFGTPASRPGATPGAGSAAGATTIEGTGMMFNPTVSWDDIAALRARWPGKLVIKGPVSAADATRAAELGVDGLQLSNHGGRQLDRTVPSVDLISRVRDAVGPDVAVLVDSGVRHGADIAVALALGADACAIGRAYLYGLMAGGEPGVDKVIDILTDQFIRTLHLMGVSSVAELRARGRELLVAP